MKSNLSKSALEYARRISPNFVADSGNEKPDIVVSFFDRPSVAATNRIISFQGSLRRDLRCNSRLLAIRVGCIEATFEIGGRPAATAFLSQIETGLFDAIAYRYKVLFVRFLDLDQIDEVHFRRDSVYRYGWDSIKNEKNSKP